MNIKELNNQFPLDENSINSSEISKKALKKDLKEREQQKELKAQSSKQKPGYVNYTHQRKKV